MFLGITMPKIAVFRPPNQTPGLTHCKCDSPIRTWQYSQFHMSDDLYTSFINCNVSEAKCRSFFDKIIQLPFRMPVESYSLKTIIEKNMKEKLEARHIEIAADFITEIMGTNPRAFKRLANSFFLIENVNLARSNNTIDKLENLMILCELCIQMCVPEIYTLLATSDDFMDKITEEDTNVETLLTECDIDISGESVEGKNFVSAAESLHSLFSKLKDERAAAITALHKTFELTAITSVSGQTRERTGQRADTTIIKKVVIGGESIPVKNATEAIRITFEKLLNNDLALVKDFMTGSTQILTLDPDLAKSTFRQKKELFTSDGKTVYLGTSTNIEGKKKQTTELYRYLKQNGNCPAVRWYGENDSSLVLELG